MKLKFFILILFCTFISLAATEKDNYYFFPIKQAWHLIELDKITPETQELCGSIREVAKMKNGFFYFNMPDNNYIGILVRQFKSKGGRHYLNIGGNRPYLEVALNGKIVAKFRTSGYDKNASIIGDNVVELDLNEGENFLAIKFGVGKELSIYMSELSQEQVASEAPTRENFAKILSGELPYKLAARIIQHGVEAMSSTVFKKFKNQPDIPKKVLEELYAKYPVLEFHDRTLDRIKAEVVAEKVDSGAVCWLLYNMGYIIKTPQSVFGIDLMHRRSEELADILDFVLVTHAHDDHYDMRLLEAMKRQGKPVISKFFPADRNQVPDKQKIKDVTIKVIETDHNAKLKNFIYAYLVKCGEGDDAPIIYHSGDSCDHRQQISKVPVDVHILHPVVGMNIPEAAQHVRPREIWFSHLWEMGHCPPSQWRPVALGDVRFIGTKVKDVAPDIKLCTPLWGERIRIKSGKTN